MPESMFMHRSKEPEIMDDLRCEGAVVAQTLKELDIINRWLGGNAVTLDALHVFFSAVRNSPRRAPLRIADLGCGGGGMLRLMARSARKNGIAVDLVGVDANPYIVDYARKRCKDFPEITFLEQDVSGEDFRKEKFDIINCTLFCHHFDDHFLAGLLKAWASQTRYGIVINDIHRHWFAYHSIKWLTGLFSSSSMVRNDAALSVLRAFTRKELETVLREAGFRNFTVRWKWAFRYEAIIYLEGLGKTSGGRAVNS